MNVWGDFFYYIKMSINFIYVYIFWDTVDRLNNIDKYEPIIEKNTLKKVMCRVLSVELSKQNWFEGKFGFFEIYL